MRSRRLPISLLLLLSIASANAVSDDDDETPTENATSVQPKPAATTLPSPPLGVIHLSLARQQAGGLVVESLQPASFQPETQGYGKVLDIQPLLELRVRYRAARADSDVAAAALGLAEKNRNRLNELHKAEIIAGRELVQAEAQWQADRTKAEQARRLMGEIRREADHTFGTVLSGLALDGNLPLLNDLAAHRRLLLLVALPAGSPPPARGTALFVSRGLDRSEAIRAELISPAPRTDELVQGETWFFHTADERLRAGMRVNVWLPDGRDKRQGVMIPLTAVVWHGGKPWAYRRIGDDDFARAEIARHRDYGDSWFVEQGFAPGENLVVSGAQMLLSEEFRGQIPDEDDD